ncbi:hypothetical protein BDV06DRAFT_200793 [Aspergillus oleicola]
MTAVASDSESVLVKTELLLATSGILYKLLWPWCVPVINGRKALWRFSQEHIWLL